MTKPAWLDTTAYPFEPHFFKSPVGRMHYVDEGAGEPIVLMHGNPGWSFEYRDIIQAMSPTHRCIAPDYIGYGLSDKPGDWDYLPQNQAGLIEQLLNDLNLNNITLVMNDWGGPLAMAYALKYPHKIRKLVICNTWFWPVKGIKNFEYFSGIAGGPIGRFLATNFNFIAKSLTKQAYGPRQKIPGWVHQHYYLPHAEKSARKGTWVFPREIIGSSDWLGTLWAQRDNIKQIPAAIVWGDSDIAFKAGELKVWTDLLENHTLTVLRKIGHFPPEEAPAEVIKALKT